MEFGLAIDFGSRTETLSSRLRSTASLLELAESVGFASVWAGEQYPTTDDYYHTPAPLHILAALAPQTGLLLGTGVTLLPAWDPLRLAYEAALLDDLCDGRLVLGVGLGSAELAARFSGLVNRLGDQMDETLEALRAMWSGEVDYHGELVQAEGPVFPKTRRGGGPAIWVGGLVRRSARRAARYGDGWYAATAYSLAHEITRQSERYRAACREHDKSTGVISANRLVAVADTDQQAVLDCGHYLQAVLHSYAARSALLGMDGQPLSPSRGALVEMTQGDVAIIGSPESVVNQLQSYAAAGVTHVQARVRPADMPLPLVKRTIRLLGEQVIPALADSSA